MWRTYSYKYYFALDSVKNKTDLSQHFKLIADFNVKENYLRDFCTDLKKVKENLVELNQELFI